MQNLFHDGGFSSVGMSLRAMATYEKGLDEYKDETEISFTANGTRTLSLPVTLGDTPIETVLPPYNKEIILGIRYFIVEDVRSARRF